MLRSPDCPFKGRGLIRESILALQICAQNSATWDMLLTSYGTKRSWDENPLLLVSNPFLI